MMSRTTYWAVTHNEHDPASGASPYIPTVGNPTSASDMYRVVGYSKTGHENWNSCYTDVNTCISLAKLIEGEVSSWADIRAAETALQLFMWHDRVDVLVPGFKQTSNNFMSYVRCDEERSQLSFDLFQPLQPFDQIYAIENVSCENNVIISSNYENSSIIGKDLQDAKQNYLNKTPLQSTVLSSIALDFGVPAYFTNPLLESNFDKAGYFHNLYKTLNSDWINNEFIPPTIESNIQLPPLMSIILTEATSRETIPDAMLSLRDKLQDIRKEILTFNQMITGSYNQIELEAECKRISESFNSIFAASRYDGSKVIFPLLKLYKFFKSPFNELLKTYNPNYTPTDPRVLANRTLTGKMFSELLITDSMHSLVSHFFTQAEVRSLEHDARKNKKKI